MAFSIADQLLPDDVISIERNPKYVSTAVAAEMLGCDHKKLWRLAKKRALSGPLRSSTRRCFWLRSEIEELAGKSAPPEDDFNVSREGAAELLGVCLETVSRMVADRRLLRGKMKGPRLYFRKKDIEEAIAQRAYNEKISPEYVSDLVDIPWYDIWRLKAFNCFPHCCDSNGRYRYGEVLDWYERYQRTGSPCGDPDRNQWFKHLVKQPCDPKNT